MRQTRSKSFPKAALFGAALLGWAIVLELGSFAYLKLMPARLNPAAYYLESMIANFHPLFQKEGGHAAHKYYPYVGYFREGDWTKNRPAGVNPPDGWVIPQGKGPDGVERYVPMEKPAGTLRVIALGGSTMAGMGQTGEDKYITSQLQANLRKAYPKRKIDVVNAAFYTYNSAEEMVLMTTKLLAYNPDLFVVMDGYNDFIKAYYFPDLPPYWGQHQEFLYRTHDRTNSIKGLLAQLGYLVSKRFYCLALPRAILFARRHHPAPAIASGSKKMELDAAPYLRSMKEYFQMQTTIIGVARAHKIPLVMAFQPNVNYKKPMSDEETRLMAEWNAMKARYTDAAEIYYPRADKQYNEFIRKHSGSGIHLYNWSGLFSSTKETLYVDSCHYSDRGAELIGRTMAPVVAAALGL